MTSPVKWMIALTLGVVPGFASPIFTDSTFNLANYSVSSPYNSDLGTATASFNQCAICGNPGQALQFLGFGMENDVLALGIVNNTFTYTPAVQGAITAINVSVDKYLAYNQPVTGGNSFRPMILQNGIYYMAAVGGPFLDNATTSGYATLAQNGLTAANFLSFDFGNGQFGGDHPDFSGNTMRFGVGQIYGVYLWNSLNVEADYDNLSISLDTSVPEPFSLVLVLAGLAGLGLRIRHTRSTSR